MGSDDLRRGCFLLKADLPALPPSRLPPSVQDAERLVREVTGERYVLARLDSGTFHHLFTAKLGDSVLFLKAAKHDALASSLGLEAVLYMRVLDRLGLGLNVLSFDVSGERYGFAHLLIEGAAGVRLRDVAFEDGQFGTMANLLGQAMACVHGTASEGGFGLASASEALNSGGLRGVHPTWTDYVYLNLASHLQCAYDNRAITADDLRFIERAFDRHKAVLSCDDPGVLLHGDLGSHNVFVTEPGDVKVIDWEDALVGDPIFDIASFASFHRMVEFLSRFLDGYRQVNPAPADRAGFHVRFWMYYLRICLAKSVVRFRLGYDKPGASVSTSKIQQAIGKLRAL